MFHLKIEKNKSEKRTVSVPRSTGSFLIPPSIRLSDSHDSSFEQNDELKRQRYRERTFFLYPKVYVKYGNKCAIPTCNEKRGLEIHHCNYNEDNTPEEMFNSMMPLCRKHHAEMTKEQKRGQQFTIDNYTKE